MKDLKLSQHQQRQRGAEGFIVIVADVVVVVHRDTKKHKPARTDADADDDADARNALSPIPNSAVPSCEPVLAFDFNFDGVDDDDVDDVQASVSAAEHRLTRMQPD